MTSINITINLDDLGEENEEGELVLIDTIQGIIQTRVVEGVSKRLIGSSHYDGMEKSIREKVQKSVDAQVKERLREILTKPIQPTSSWNGAPEGDPVSIETIAKASLEKYLKAPSRDSRSSYDNAGNLSELVNDIVKKEVMAELKPTIDAAKKSVSDLIVKQALAGAVAALTPAVK
ncbi:MAG: hypothetical protein JWM23_585 [Microbacteriaceae bacterium]|nr:hypothetical protein [Microbacteriaceae bacterium]